MDNFRRPVRHNASRHRALDGFTRKPQVRRGKSSKKEETVFTRTEQTRPPREHLIGNFSQSDGFQPVEQPMVHASGSVALPSPNAREGGFKLPRLSIPFRRRHASRKRLSKKQIIKRSLLVLLIVVLLGGGFLALKTYLTTRNIFKGGANGAAALNENVDPSVLKGEGDGRINILMLGRGGAGHTAPDLTDTILLLSIDPIHDEAAILSIPRDFWVKNPTGGSSKLNAVFANSKNAALAKKKTADEADGEGLKAVESVLSDAMGVPIHYYVMVDFEAFRKAIDTVGGIDINVQEALYDPTVAWENNWNPLIAAKGWQHFNGDRALLYARSRQTSARGDFARGDRQREIILALKDKVFSAGTFGNPIKISQLVDAFGNHVQTDMSIDEVLRLYEITKDISGNKVGSLSLADQSKNLITTANIGGLSVVVPRAGTFEYRDIQAFVRNAFKDAFIRQENASILVLNGTTRSGLAASRADDLKSYGYNITHVADAPSKAYEETIVVDLRGGEKKYTKHYLEQRFGTVAVSQLPEQTIQPGSADFVIILGNNEANSN